VGDSYQAPIDPQRRFMNIARTRIFAISTLFAASGLIFGCSSTESKSPDVTGSIRTALDQAGLKDVSVSQDRVKGVVTLNGTTASDADRLQAETIAKAMAGSQVVADQIAVRPPGDESTAKKVDSALDEGIEKNLEAQLLLNKMIHDVKYDVKNGVVTLTGELNSTAKRARAEKLASDVPNVRQVVNKIEVKNMKATSTM
jgi:hyperosmotically inducible periplasmic protein